ncbi:putative glycoside hydrolase [Jeotgalibacillus sp. HH7-29]|uniref:Glycoside hydrolase n=1 Tax=Jeotgalibacillus haloalkalitolerans TaxID=3104292 RepID=A0ABU5KP20_9BACL|nr:putative glycoside hydrolase [Jeotgalibacillus sp. HH7-29]MDZ5713007.1 putative glycoside hydrolase [Jeotgalibacillus sp. HH7-29]
MSLKYIATSASAAILAFTVFSTDVNAEAHEQHQIREMIELQKNFPESMPRFVYDSGLSFEYPDAVRGIYVTGHSAGGERFQTLLDLMDNTDLNAMVVDVKEDHGYLTYLPEEDSSFKDIGQPYIKDMREMLETLEEHEVYPIARVVVFKDSVLAEKRPDLSFQENGQVWANGRGESFVNPFMKEVWDYNVEIAIEAAKMGFKEIQFDYVRFPEGFETRDDTLVYGTGDYVDDGNDDTNERVDAVTDFVEYASEQLEPYDVDVSVDIFGYSATLPEAPGIGQNFNRISEHVDVISSMIYPSHWTSYFGIDKPDLEPYNLISEYAKVENAKLGELENPPTSRPWIQDFTASYLGAGNYLVYGPDEVKAQIDALYDNGINEFLLWNAGNTYTGGVDYLP